MEDKTVCFLIREKPGGEILLGYKKVRFGPGNTGFGPGNTGFGPGVEPGETIEAAAIRELEEETGVKVSEENLHQLVA